MPKEFELSGLSHSNLLAFLTLMGTMKLLDRMRPDWAPQSAWKNYRPIIYVNVDIKKEQFLDALLEGLKEFGNRMEHIKQENLRIEVDEFTKLQKTIEPEIIAALGSDGALDKEEIVQSTPLCMMFGSGHQYFLKRLRDATCVDKTEDKQVAQEIDEALFSEWYSNDNDSENKQNKLITFRWDPQEYRPHAYRAMNPSAEPITSMNGANRLAAVGFTVYDCAPTKQGLRTASYKEKQKMNNGMRKQKIDSGNNDEIFWPIWKIRLSLASVLTLMHYPYVEQITNIEDAKIRQDLDTYGIEHVMKAVMFWDGKYKNVLPAKRIM